MNEGEVFRVAFTDGSAMVFERRDNSNYLTTEMIRVGDRATVIGRLAHYDLLMVRLDSAPAKVIVTADNYVRALTNLEQLGEAFHENRCDFHDQSG
jgi:hypothetical protein